MVSFTCGVCQDVVTKNQVDKHCSRPQCTSAWHFTCIDCNKTFEGYDYQSHTSCISEEDKYYGKFAKRKKEKATDVPTKNPNEKESQERAHESSINNKKCLGVEPTQPSRVQQTNLEPLRKKKKRAPVEEAVTASARPESEQAVSPIPWVKLIEKVVSSQTEESIGWESLANQVVKIVMKDSRLSYACEGLTEKRLVQKCLSEASIPARLLAPETPLRLVVARSL
eukprot:GHVS01006553.1.p1 GENE.GHVS01006553.1~~GHVS01006553.1.p1  ORF type:complete len:225 (+),score=17.32 GHVS01006553.1:63-737(+)